VKSTGGVYRSFFFAVFPSRSRRRRRRGRGGRGGEGWGGGRWGEKEEGNEKRGTNIFISVP